MECEEKVLEELVGMIHGEVDGARSQELHRHLSACHSCREFYEGSIFIIEAHKRIQLIEPSAQFRIKLEERVRDAIGQGKAEGQVRTGASSVRSSTSSPSTVAVGDGFPKRPSFLVRPVERDGSRRRYRIRRSILSAVAIVTVALAAIYFIRIEGTMPRLTTSRKGSEIEFRAAQRRQASHFALELRENLIEFPAEFDPDPDDRSMNLLIASDHQTNEKCLVLFTAKQWKEMKEPSVEPIKVSFEGRVLAIPARLASRILGGAQAQVAVLKLKDRIEIWSKPSLDLYFQAGPEIHVVPEKIQPAQPESSPNSSSSTFQVEIGPA